MKEDNFLNTAILAIIELSFPQMKLLFSYYPFKTSNNVINAQTDITMQHLKIDCNEIVKVLTI